MSKSDVKLIAGVSALGLFFIAIVVGCVLLIIDQERYYDDLQRQQDKCLDAGGMWIDNKHTDPYCFFNK
ncbi:hypothetical protein SEA_SHAM_241 [Streptomyces phage Sham]|nr:hypothetical protein SEA_SHAM_241 [Streptomyces phage Sham]